MFEGSELNSILVRELLAAGYTRFDEVAGISPVDLANCGVCRNNADPLSVLDDALKRRGLSGIAWLRKRYAQEGEVAAGTLSNNEALLTPQQNTEAGYIRIH